MPAAARTPIRATLALCGIAWASAGWAQPVEPGRELRLPVNRDTWVSDFGEERQGNLGAENRLKLKGIQELSLIDFDPAPLRGWTLKRATLHLHPLTQERPGRLSVSSVSSPWTEGSARQYRVQRGSASFAWAEQDQRPWAEPGSDVTAVINGAGHSLWSFSDPVPAQDKLAYAIDPRVIAARVAGLSHGLALTDDVGSEYRRDGEAFKHLLFLNRFVASREMGPQAAPRLTVELDEQDREPPGACAELAGATRDPWGEPLPAGEAQLRWRTPVDVGPAGVLGFVLRHGPAQGFDWDRAQYVPRHLIPIAPAPGETVTMRLRDMGWAPGESRTVALRAVDAAGNAGPTSTLVVTASAHASPPIHGGLSPFPSEPAVALPRLAGREVFVLDELDKITPGTGELIPARPEAYRQANHLWSASLKQVRLQAARGETVAFQLVLAGGATPDAISLTWDRKAEKPEDAVRFSVLRVESISAAPTALPDPVTPWPRPGGVARGSGNWDAWLVELATPQTAAPGEHHGTLSIKAGDATLDLALSLRVWCFGLPDRLSFIPQMNCYSLPGDPGDQLNLSYYRMAHAHRVCLNRLGYNWAGKPHGGMAPVVKDGRWDFREFDRRFSPLFTGSAFSGQVRGPTPVEAFYLPLNENWPMDVHAAFKGPVKGPGVYWIEDAFDAPYWDAFEAACRRFAEHLAERKWNSTHFEFYLNNKVYFKKDRGWSKVSAPWIFDEPVNTQDFWALRAYGERFHRAVAPVRAAHAGAPSIGFRCDISRPQWQRDLLDGVLDYNVVGGAFYRYPRRVTDRSREWGEMTYVYGGNNQLTQSNVAPTAWCIDAWTLGADGVIPWQTVGRAESWGRPDEESLFYPGAEAGLKGPVASLRLKAYRRGQQDVECLAMLGRTLGEPRWAIGRAVRESLKLRGVFASAGGEDAGRVSYDNVSPADLWRLRTAVAGMLDAAAEAGLPTPPAPELRTPVRRPEGLKAIRVQR